MRRVALAMTFIAILSGLLLLSPAIPALKQYGAFPRKATGPINVLLAGVTHDYDEHAGVWPWPAKPDDFTFLTDTIILAQVWPDGRTQLLSVPRDTWVSLPGYGWSKINAANHVAGPDLLVRAVRNVTGLPVDGYVLLSMKVLSGVTQAAGGVTLNVPKRMKYDDTAGHLHIDLQPGWQRLNGPQAEGFLRYRHDRLADIARAGRQQLYLTALAAQLERPLQWWRLPRVVAVLHANTKTNLTKAQMAAVFGGLLSGVQVTSYTLPGHFGGVNWIPDDQAIHTLVGEHFRDPNDPRGLAVAVVNVGAPDGSARRLKGRLEDLGYTNVWTSNAPRANVPTTVSGQAAGALVSAIGYGQVSG